VVGIKGPDFIVLHKNVSHNRGNGRTHSCALILLVAHFVKGEKGIGKAKFDKLKDFRAYKLRNELHGFRDRNFDK